MLSRQIVQSNIIKYIYVLGKPHIQNQITYYIVKVNWSATK